CPPDGRPRSAWHGMMRPFTCTPCAPTELSARTGPWCRNDEQCTARAATAGPEELLGRVASGWTVCTAFIRWDLSIRPRRPQRCGVWRSTRYAWRFTGMYKMLNRRSAAGGTAVRSMTRRDGAGEPRDDVSGR